MLSDETGTEVKVSGKTVSWQMDGDNTAPSTSLFFLPDVEVMTWIATALLCS